MTEFRPDAERQWVRYLLHPYLICMLLPSSVSPTPNYMLQWAMVVGVGVPALLLASTPPAPGFGTQYQRMAGVVALCAATATIAGFFFGGTLGPSAAGPLGVLLLLLLLANYRPAQPYDATTDQIGVLLAATVIVGLGTLQTLGVGPAWSFTAQFYSASYPQLIPGMRIGAEPVATSATHSVAACVYAVVSLTASMVATRATHRMAWALRVAAFLCWVLVLRLQGSTAFLMAGVLGIAFVGRFGSKLAERQGIHRRLVFRAAILAVAPFVAIMGYKFYVLQRDYPYMGFTGRFASTGPYSQVGDLGTRLLSGSGFIEAPGYLYADSGIVKNLVRYGVVGFAALIAFYVLSLREMAALHPRGTRIAVASPILILGLFMTFEAGYEVLASPRLVVLVFAFLSVARRHFAQTDAADIPQMASSARGNG